jgi:hypothetical protein
MKQMEFYAKHQKKVSWILKTMRPFIFIYKILYII